MCTHYTSIHVGYSLTVTPAFVKPKTRRHFLNERGLDKVCYRFKPSLGIYTEALLEASLLYITHTQRPGEHFGCIFVE
jgi:hypothetical protein